MSHLAVRVVDLAKRYRIGAAVQPHRSLREAVVSAAASPFRNLARLRRLSRFDGTDEGDVVWALRGLSFEVPVGKATGIIGRNGAGKSTLLKILSRITDPTHGRAEVRGRVGSLLEVGTGFHPELTGRENVYLNGSILGMDRRYIDRRFDEIIEFAGVGRFVDTPVKRYSSGMYLRLAFAVAAHLEPDVLIVDEVLAVGDAEFQKKCLGKMGEVAGEGRTVLFVSHNLGAIRTLCDSVVLLSGGRKVAQGEPAEVVSQYLATDSSTTTGERRWEDVATAPGDSQLRVNALRIRGSHPHASGEVSDDDELTVEIEFTVLQPVRNPHVGFHLLTPDGVLVFESHNGDHVGDMGLMAPGTYRSVCKIPPLLLNTGTYLVKLHGHIPNVRYLFTGEEVLLPFTVIHTVNLGAGEGGRDGVIRPSLAWETAATELAADAGFTQASTEWMGQPAAPRGR
jgi:lipopolysaccharide transport system ATP-binding protein